MLSLLLRVLFTFKVIYRDFDCFHFSYFVLMGKEDFNGKVQPPSWGYRAIRNKWINKHDMMMIVAGPQVNSALKCKYCFFEFSW